MLVSMVTFSLYTHIATDKMNVNFNSEAYDSKYFSLFSFRQIYRSSVA